MELEQVSLIVGIASFIGAIVGAGLTNIVTARIAAHERREARRKERLEYLRGLLNSLIRVSWELHQHNSAADPLRYKAWGEAIGVMLATPDNEVREKALTVRTGEVSREKDERRDAIEFAIGRLGQMINSVMQEKL